MTTPAVADLPRPAPGTAASAVPRQRPARRLPPGEGQVVDLTARAAARHEHDWRVVAVEYEASGPVTERGCIGCGEVQFV